MEQTSQNTFIKILVAVVVLALILVGVVYFVKSKNSTEEAGNTPVSEETTDTMRITAQHQFKNGTHTVAGEVMLPSPCHSLSTTVGNVAANATEATIAFKVNQPTGDGVCAQVLTPARFRVEFKAAQRAEIKATWNGKPAILNLVPVAAGADVNTPVFIKG